MGHVKQTTFPANECVTLAQFQEYMGLPSGFGQTVTISAMLAGARVEGEKMTGRALARRTFRQVMDGLHTQEKIKLYYPPVVSVEQIQYVAIDGTTNTIDPDDYALDNVSEPATISPAPLKCWPYTRCAPGSVMIDFTAGYGQSVDMDADSLPDTLKMGILNLAAYWFQNRGANHPNAATGKGFDIPPYIERIFKTQAVIDF